jgi:methylated-DNA-[protein]-cysteine S-methyltransferase
MSEACALFDTPIGRCGIAWGPRGIQAFQLPSTGDSATLRALARRAGHLSQEAPPPDVQGVIERIVSLLEGRPVDLRDVPLDMHGIPEFHQRVYALSREIQPGQTRSYGELARELGDVAASRAVGQALGSNPFAIIVPCHRVLAAGGASGGFSAPGGVTTKLRILLIEKAQIGEQPGLF